MIVELFLVVVGSFVLAWLLRKFVEWLCYPFVPMSGPEYAASSISWVEDDEEEHNA